MIGRSSFDTLSCFICYPVFTAAHTCRSIEMTSECCLIASFPFRMVYYGIYLEALNVLDIFHSKIFGTNTRADASSLSPVIMASPCARAAMQ